MPGSLNVFRWNVYSENGEDGVIKEIFRRLGVNTGWFCEFGAWDGRYGSNSYKLLRERWHGIMIEGNPARFQRLLSLQGKKPDKLVAIETFVGWEANDPNKLDHILARTPIPQNFEFLSVDIDGFDYQVWEALNVYRPLVVLIEIDSSILPGIRHVYSPGDQTGNQLHVDGRARPA